MKKHEIETCSHTWISYSRNHSSVRICGKAIWAIFLHSYQLMNILNMVCPIGRLMRGFKKAEASGKREMCMKLHGSLNLMLTWCAGVAHPNRLCFVKLMQGYWLEIDWVSLPYR
ncbi:hypothetical protein TNCV_885621 [Trichonephila clavipes]|nr:hypothetical protein TNCV_885621 [Trichonephila clavipes]